MQACVASLMREGRVCIISAKLEEQSKIERAAKERERASQAAQIAEEKKAKDLQTWVSDWAQAQQMRDFIAALEKVWIQEGHDLSPDVQKGQRIVSMKQQADWLDAMLPSPPSILARKDGLGRY